MKLNNMLAALVVTGTMLLLTPRSVSALLIDEYGQLHVGWFGQILGKDDDEDTDISQNIEDGDEVERSLDAMEEEVKMLEKTVQTDTNQEDIRTEVRFSDESRIKTRLEDNRTRTDVYQGGTKVRMEHRDGETRIKIENEETGEEEELPVEDENDEILEIRERAERDSVTVSTSGDQFVIRRNDIGALAHFPLSVDLSTNTLMVSTPTGEKSVTILPDQAVRNMLAANVIDQLGGPGFTQLVQENPDLSLGQIVRLIQTQQGTLAYEVPGIRQQRLLSFIPVVIETTAIVSADTGELLDTQSSFVNRLLDFVSF